ncbi:MAG: TolC family protein [Bdellovibrionota bacterium]
MKFIVTGLCLNFSSLGASAVTLDEYMNLVLKKNQLLNSYEISIEASKEKQTAGDLSLSPTLTAGYSIATDKSEPIIVADKRTTTLSNIGLAKKFSSGTTVSLTADTSKNDYELPVTAGNTGFSRAGLGINLQQSLWKDFFGVGIRLRQDREVILNKFETYGFELQRRRTLIEAESDFWDYIVAQEDLKLKTANLERAKKLDSWTANRVYNGISDKSDLLQVRALTSLRELEFATVQDELKTREIKIKLNINLAESENMPELSANLKDTRTYIADMVQKKNIVKIESYLNLLDAELKQKLAEEVTDSQRPDLTLIGRYNTSSYNIDYAEAQKNISKTDRPITFAGLSFSWMFGSDAKSSQVSAAKKDALAAKYKAEQAQIASENAWKEHLRKYELTNKNVLTLEKIAQLQRDRAAAEREKFSKGRTITSNVVNAETDSAEADVNYLKAKSGLRKLEAATQLFISVVD